MRFGFRVCFGVWRLGLWAFLVLLGFSVWSSGFWVSGFWGFGIKGLGLRGLGFRD